MIKRSALTSKAANGVLGTDNRGNGGNCLDGRVSQIE